MRVILTQQVGLEETVLALTQRSSMKKYELTVMIHPDLEMNLEPTTDKVKALIEENGGNITKESNEGRKHMAYAIKGEEYAIYYYYEVELPPAAPAKLSSVFNITDEVIRYLLVTEDPRKVKMQAKKAARRAAAASTDESASAEEEE